MTNESLKNSEDGVETLKPSVETGEVNVDKEISETSSFVDKEVANSSSKKVEVSEANPEENAKIDQATAEANAEKDKLKAEVEGQLKSLETKEEYPEGHILNSKTLDRVAQLEAIDWNTLDFSQSKYDEYIKEQAKLAPYNVESNQKAIKERMDKGREFERSLGKTETIYGRGGVNRYVIDMYTGKLKLSRGPSNTSGNPEYKAKLAQKAKELGFMVDE